MDRVINWITACAILHNFLQQEEDHLDPEEFNNSSLPEDQVHASLAQEVGEQSGGLAFREARIDAALQVGLGPHGIITFQRRVNEQQLRERHIRQMERERLVVSLEPWMHIK